MTLKGMYDSSFRKKI